MHFNEQPRTPVGASLLAKAIFQRAKNPEAFAIRVFILPIEISG
jgi:hypothetical protein